MHEEQIGEANGLLAQAKALRLNGNATDLSRSVALTQEAEQVSKRAFAHGEEQTKALESVSKAQGAYGNWIVGETVKLNKLTTLTLNAIRKELGLEPVVRSEGEMSQSDLVSSYQKFMTSLQADGETTAGEKDG